MRAGRMHNRIKAALRVAGILIPIGTGAVLLGEDRPFALKVDVSLVSLDVAVYNLPGDPVSGLTPDEFVLLEDGIPQEIRHFEPSDAPYNALLMFDVSGSTQAQFPFMLDAANRFLSELRFKDQLAIATFNTAVTKLLDWRTRQGSFQQVPVPYTGGGTDFYSALRWAAVELGRPSGRKGAIFLTDGYDRRLFQAQDARIEERDFQEVLRAVEESRSPFYFVVVGTVNPGNGIMVSHASMAPPKKAVERMQTVAERSGGRVLFAKTIQDVASLYQGIARELSASYTLSYHSSRPQADGTYRRIQVQVQTPGFRTTQSRNGYWATGNAAHKKISSATVPNSAPARNSQEIAAGIPVLITPIAQAMLSAPETDAWRFSWEKIPQAARYEIRISAEGTTLLNSETRAENYVVRKLVNGGGNSNGWSWKVRAQYANGDWGPWSESRSFEVFRNR